MYTSAFTRRHVLLALFSLLSAPALLATTISPSTVTMKEGATQQFTASKAATWSTTCYGTLSTSGYFRAPLYPKTCSVTAKAKDGSGSASATVHIVSPITITPVSATTPYGGKQQFKASAPVTWVARCGSITSAGLFTASAPVGSNCGVNATASSGLAYHSYASDKITSPTSFSISPTTASLSEHATKQFTASAAATWTASCGSVSSSGLYTAPLAPGSCTITATNSSGAKATATATVTAPFSITPATAATPQGQTQQFTASIPVTWSATCGSITTGGLFTASSAPGVTCTIQAIASSGTAYVAYAHDTSGTAPAVAIQPLNPTVSEGAAQSFTANVPVTWTASCGTIGASNGSFTAPFTTGACTVKATAISGGSTASTTATITSPITITPASATTLQGQTQQFMANVAVNWSAACGSISASGLYTAPTTSVGSCVIQATASSGPAYTATAIDTIGGAPPTLTISPINPQLSEGAAQQFSATAPVTWSASCGVINPTSGSFTAPLTAGSCVIAAAASDGSGKTASTTATITSPITISPETIVMHAIGVQQFTASTAVTWTASCGSIDPNSGNYTAPPSAGSCTITATASSGTAYTTQGTANVSVVNYLAWKNGSSNLGVEADELLLTPSNVASSGFGVKWTANLDGYIYAQPLYVNGLNINGTAHNVVFVSTSNDTIYALDGNTGAQLWSRSFLSSGVTAVTGTTVNSSTPQIGVLGTPVIDLNSGTLYAVAETAEQTNTYFPHRLHALDITTGSEKFGGPVLISDPNLPPIHKMERTGLVLANGNVYFGFGSIGDRAPYSGFIFAFDATSLAHKYTWTSTPSGSEGGIWMSGGSPAVDPSGNLYVATGNGSFDGSNNFGESAVKLSPSLSVLDSFTPYNYTSLDTTDSDLGSGSFALLPDQSGQHPHEAILCGKTPSIYVLDRDHLGGLGTGSDNIIQRLDNVVGTTNTAFRDANQSCFATPAFWNGNLYIVGNHDALKVFTLDPSTGLLSSSPVAQGPYTYNWPGSQPVISAHGTTNGIVWTLDQGSGTLTANDAGNITHQLFQTTVSGGINRFTAPTVVNGFVYVGGQFKLVAYSLQ